MIMRIFLLLLLLWSVEEVNSFNPGTDTEDDVSGSGKYEDDCSTGNYTFNSMVNVPNSVSCNIIIDISTDILLSSNVLLKGVNNITIVGKGDPIVNCNDTGSVKFVSCNNVTIEGVNWERCGSVNNPGIEFNNASNITIQSCSFQHSTGKAVSLSKVSGNVSINNCRFTHNKYHKGHGAAIYYTSSHEQSTQLVINNCNFTLNGPAESVVYIVDNYVNAVLQNSKFTKNQGVSVHISNTTLVFNYIVSFKDNKATAGGAIYSSNSIIKFDDKCNVSFYSNSAKHGGAIYQTHSKLFFKLNAAVMFASNIGEDRYKVGYGGAIYSTQSSLISFEDQSVVTFSDNKAKLGGALNARNTDIRFHGSYSKQSINNSSSGAEAPCAVDDSVMSCGDTSTVTFTGNNAYDDGGAINAADSNITFYGHSNVTFRKNHAEWIGGGAISITASNFLPYMSISFGENSTVTFTENSASDNGGAIHVEFCNCIFHGHSKVTFSRNHANRYGGAIELENHYSINNYLSFRDNSTASFFGNSARHGGAVYAAGNMVIRYYGQSSVPFSSNYAEQAGGAIFQRYFSRKIDPVSTSLLFTDRTTVIFSNNSVISEGSGGALYVNADKIFSYGPFKTVIISFTGKSKVVFSNNTAQQGGALYHEGEIPEKLIFQGNTNVTFTNNRAKEGGAVYYSSPSHITFTGSAVVNVYNNEVLQSGGAILLSHNSIIWFTGGSTIYFNNNLAKQHGGAIHLIETAQIFFSENSTSEFCNNTASLSGGVISSLGNCKIWFTGRSTIYFNNNLARQHGGAISSVSNARITFNETCSVTFTNNTAMQQGGAVYLLHNCAIAFEDSCNVSYNNNTALQHGGAVYLTLQSVATFKGNSVICFIHNKALLSGGALYSFINKLVIFKENSTALFYHNTVRQDGGAIQSVNSSLKVSGNSSVNFKGNMAMQQGGALNLFYSTSVVFQDESNIIFTHNTAMQHGGAVYTHDNSSVSFVGNTKVVFNHNMVESDGGALYSYDHCNITIGQYSEVMFVSNSAMQFGGAMYCDHHSDVTLEGLVTFTRNTAEHGGAVCASQSVIKFTNNSMVTLINNRVLEDGGGLYFSNNFSVIFDNDSTIKFVQNTAHRYGGAMYSEVNHGGLSKLKFNTTNISFTDNKALRGNSAYLDLPTSCDQACLDRSIVGASKESLKHGPLTGHIHTPPSKLELRDPAVCIDDDNGTECETYYITNKMLGQEIITDACVLDYYDQRADETQFMVYSNSENHTISGSNSVLISCTQLEGISVTGFKVFDKANFTINLTSHAGSNSNLRTISIKLITELSPCHPGFYYDEERCVCYDDSDIISCSSSTSFIKRGYWFGVVNDKSTVTVCPNDYCNFTCCEVTNGFYQLSPARINQCSSHRSGTACGSCDEGYALSFDSVECVSADNCTTGQTVLVVTLSMIYWIVIVILVFIMTYYHVGIGYLYAITYYYSILDILLSNRLNQSKGLFTAVSTMSSVIKITPQFLGQLCFVEDMSGIDQQFIHYTHPLAVLVIIVIICQAAKMSYKFSSFISRGIIRSVCFLLLLSYTSVATTSLLLLRSLTFDNVDKVYTYLSPDIEYCHGRHLPYFIVALLCTLVIVIGLPLILLLEPFLNHRINFTRMKPLLDQFQGCYKDKHRCFAAYYMICRLVIIVIIISIPSSNNLSQLLLIFSSIILAFIPLFVRPYDHKILNKFDALILLFVFLVTLIPLADTVSQQLSTATIIIVMILPLIFFIILELIVHKETIKTIATKITTNFTAKSVPTTINNNDIPMGDIGLVIDDNMRKNATICEIPSNTSDDVTHYRESFMEVMDQIKD